MIDWVYLFNKKATIFRDISDQPKPIKCEYCYQAAPEEPNLCPWCNPQKVIADAVIDFSSASKSNR